MKLFNNHNEHNDLHHDEPKGFFTKMRQYVRNLFRYSDREKMPRGSYDIMISRSWARGDNWRRNSHKSKK